MDTGLKDKVVFITGASGGIGAAVAELMAAEGARLVLHRHKGQKRATALAERLPGDPLVVTADVAREDQVETAFEAALKRWGQIDVLVANAGIWPEQAAPVHEMTLARWQQVMDVNLTGVFLSTRAFFRHLARRRPPDAALILMGSTAAMFGEEGHAAYAAGKAAITHGLTLSLKNEIVRLSPGGRVNAVCPGWTRTPMAAAGLKDDDAVRSVLQTRSLTKIAEPKDVAAAVVYLASPVLAGHVSGQILTVAGGMEGRLLHRPDTVNPAQA
ncbi:MAG: SDR family oxidoreductase [Acidobacteria bacterium]|nr:SDR family oxidoreductase [Acidobacteriota bacterium]